MKDGIITIKCILIQLLLLLFCGKMYAQAPAFAWVKGAVSTQHSEGKAMVVDSLGNSYVAGNFAGTIMFGSITLNSGSVNNADIFLVKYDPSGTVLWARKGGSDTDYDEITSMAIDGENNVYLTGYFYNIATFGSISLPSLGNTDIYIAKYNTSGTVIWAKRTGSETAGPEGANCIIVDQNKNIYLTGFFTDSITFDTVKLNGKGLSDIFIVKFDSLGNTLWANSAGSIGYDKGNGIAFDETGNSYVTGYFSDTATFGSIILNPDFNHDHKLFIAKYSALGSLIRVQGAGDFGASGLGIAADAKGNYFVTGYFRKIIHFGNDSIISPTFWNISDDVLLAKFDSAGNYRWGYAGGSDNGDQGNAVVLDNSGNSYVTGDFTLQIVFGQSWLSCNYDPDPFIAKFDSSGQPVWGVQATGLLRDRSNAIAIDGSGNCFITGYSDYALNFGVATLTTNSCIYIAKLDHITGHSEELVSDVSIYPNPFSSQFQVKLEAEFPARITLNDMVGREVYHQVISETTAVITPSENLPPGLYILQIQQGEILHQRRVIKQ